MGLDKGRKGERRFPGVGPQSLVTFHPRRSLSLPRPQSEPHRRKCIQSLIRPFFCPRFHEETFTFYMTVIVCSYGKGLRPVSFIPPACLPCLSLHRSIPRRIGSGETESRYSPAYQALHSVGEALGCHRIALWCMGRVKTAPPCPAIVRG